MTRTQNAAHEAKTTERMLFHCTHTYKLISALNFPFSFYAHPSTADQIYLLYIIQKACWLTWVVLKAPLIPPLSVLLTQQPAAHLSICQGSSWAPRPSCVMQTRKWTVCTKTQKEEQGGKNTKQNSPWASNKNNRLSDYIKDAGLNCLLHFYVTFDVYLSRPGGGFACLTQCSLSACSALFSHSVDLGCSVKSVFCWFNTDSWQFWCELLSRGP